MEKVRETLKVKKERAILVAAHHIQGPPSDDLAELTSLAETAGAIIVDRFQQKIRRVNPATYIGKGKASMLAGRVKRNKADVIIFDNDLSPAQIRELEKISGAKVLDRSELILDIFATRAQTKQARLQVDLAQLEYTYPRLTRMWTHLDTVTGAAGGTAAGAVGGIGTRGTGESQLEIDRRLVNKRITDLKRQLAQIDKRKMREIKSRRDMFQICLVGYTNAGKSTLINKLTDSDVFVEDRLFATLDTRTRKWNLGGGIEVLLSDTVGFVRNLPHHLVASFKATLEEAVHADLLLHVIDASSNESERQIEAAESVLEEIGCGDKPSIKLFNKVDTIRDGGSFDLLNSIYPDALHISAKSGLGLEELRDVVLERYRGSRLKVRVVGSQADGRVQNFLRAFGEVLSEEYNEDEVHIEAMLGQNQLPGLQRLRPIDIQIQ